MALLIALVNIIGWGFIPLTVKDSPQSQIAGMGSYCSYYLFVHQTSI